MKLTAGQKQALVKEIHKKFKEKFTKAQLPKEKVTEITKAFNDYITIKKQNEVKIKGLQDAIDSNIDNLSKVCNVGYISHYELNLKDILRIAKEHLIKIPQQQDISHKMELLSIGDVKTVDELIKSVMNEFNGSHKEEDDNKGKEKSTTKKPVKKTISKAAIKTKGKKS